jgi:hypothetical protein
MEELQDEIIEKIIEVCKKSPRERVKGVSVPFSLLYSHLLRRGDIAPMRELPPGEKLKYWDETKGSKFQRVIQCQGLYIYDLITLPEV